MIEAGIIDAHLHLWDLDQYHYPWLDDTGSEDLRRNYLPEHYAQDAKDVNVTATVHVQAELDHAVDPVAETSWLQSLATASGSEGAAVPTVCVGYADLRAPNLDDVLDRHQQHALFRGVRQQAWYDPDSAKADIPRYNLLDDPTWLAGLRMLAARGLTFDLQVRPHQLEQAATIFSDIPELPLVLEHTGLPTKPDPEYRDVWRTGMRMFAEHVPHAVLKISALRFVSATWSISELAPVVSEAIDIFGPDRCMFGSNFPVDKPAIPYADLWRICEEMTRDFSADERAALFRENAARTYHINL